MADSKELPPLKKKLSRYKVDDSCTLCSLCIGSCPFEAIEQGRSNRGYPKFLVRPELCNGCRLCLPACPIGAIVKGEQPELMAEFS